MFKKVIFTSKTNIFNFLVNNWSFTESESKTKFEIYKWFFNFSDTSEEIILCKVEEDNLSLFEAITFVFENYNIIRVISLDFATSLDNNLFWKGDILAPNTFITEDSLPPVFLENVADNNYQIWDFWFLMNWVCYSKIWEISDEKFSHLKSEAVDIIDDNAYALVTNSEIKWLKENTIILRAIDTENEVVLHNLFEILEIII